MNIFNSKNELAAWRAALPAGCSVGFVPTMGALHRGHAELLRRSRLDADISVLSIFVNPTQFAPTEDLAKYPRTLEADLAVARECGVDAVYVPTAAEVYPEGSSTWVEETSVSVPLCGRFRPGHFRGVMTVVLKLFNVVRPTIATFGLKDAQQYFVLAKMVRDLDVAVTLQGVPTVREPDGLALSSRNAYLSAEERERAPLLQTVLRDLAGDAAGLTLVGDAASLTLVGDAARLTARLASARRRLEDAGFRPQYLELLELPGLQPVERLASDRAYLIAAAAHLGATRLIDNVIVRPELLSKFGVTP